MKIVNIAASIPYNDYWGYQDNLLPKYQIKLGHAVTLIATNYILTDDGNKEVPCEEYDLTDGTHIVRLPLKKYYPPVMTHVNDQLVGLYQILCREKPDFVFFHGICSLSIRDVIRYKKRVNPRCVIVQDNHLDYNIGHSSTGIKKYILRSYYRFINRFSVRYVSRIYGVTPWRKTYAEDYFGIPSDKTDVLIMGADDEKIDFQHRDAIRQKIRSQYQLNDNDFLIVTGGKIDAKKQIIPLMEACLTLDHVKLIVFGSVLPDVKERFDALVAESDKITYIGWLDADKVYDYYFAADLAAFPGQHSVLWEQACAAKIPCLFGKWDGMDHVNNGGNSVLVERTDSASLQQEIASLLFTEKYQKMLQVARSEATDIYLYSHIAEKSLECLTENEA